MRVLTAACLLLAFVSTPARALDKAQKDDLIVQCAACHGADGIARDAEVPDIAGQHDVYLYKRLKEFAAGRSSHKEMRFMGRHLTDDDMQVIAEYYASLPKQ